MKRYELYLKYFRNAYFNAPEETNNDTGAGVGDVGGGTSTNEPEPKKLTFDDMLNNREYQSEFDKRVQKAINTALTNAKEQWENMANDKLSEAEKLAKMTNEQKQEYQRQKKEKELSEREASLTKRELEAEAKTTLIDKGLPSAFSNLLNYSDAESCNESIDTIVKAFSEAVEKAVNEKLKGGRPPKKADTGEITSEQFKKMNYEQRLKLKMENPEAFKQLSK